MEEERENFCVLRGTSKLLVLFHGWMGTKLLVRSVWAEVCLTEDLSAAAGETVFLPLFIPPVFRRQIQIQQLLPEMFYCAWFSLLTVGVEISRIAYVILLSLSMHPSSGLDTYVN